MQQDWRYSVAGDLIHQLTQPQHGFMSSGR